MYYSIKETLTKEENLELAKAYEDKAKEYLNQFNELLKNANKDFPGRTLGLSKSKKEKLKTPNEVYERLQFAVRSYNHTKSIYEIRERMVKEKEEKEKQAELLKQREAEKVNLVNEAIVYCLNNGRVFGDGLSVETAISIANEIAFQKEIKRREEEIGDNYIYFSGHSCKYGCAGWNPHYHRCNCGNRRVGWVEGYYSDFRNMEVYAEAY